MERTRSAAIVALAWLLTVPTVSGDQTTPGAQGKTAAPAGALVVELRAALERRLHAIAAGLDGVLGYSLIDFTTGESVAARLDSESFPTASTIKLAILYDLLKQAEEGRLRLDEPKPLARSQIVGGSGVLQHLSSPVLSLRDHTALMIVVSDNTSTNVVIDAVGMSNVSARAQALGLADVRLRRKMMDVAGAQRGEENVATPEALAKLAGVLWKGEGLNASSRDSARAILRAVPGALRASVPAEIPVASKTGELSGVRAEAGVVELEGRPYAIAVMTTFLKDDAEGVRAIRDVGRAAFDYMYRIARGGAYGRR